MGLISFLQLLKNIRTSSTVISRLPIFVLTIEINFLTSDSELSDHGLKTYQIMDHKMSSHHMNQNSDQIRYFVFSQLTASTVEHSR